MDILLILLPLLSDDILFLLAAAHCAALVGYSVNRRCTVGYPGKPACPDQTDEVWYERITVFGRPWPGHLHPPFDPPCLAPSSPIFLFGGETIPPSPSLMLVSCSSGFYTLLFLSGPCGCSAEKVKSSLVSGLLSGCAFRCIRFIFLWGRRGFSRKTIFKSNTSMVVYSRLCSEVLEEVRSKMGCYREWADELYLFII